MKILIFILFLFLLSFSSWAIEQTELLHKQDQIIFQMQSHCGQQSVQKFSNFRSLCNHYVNQSNLCNSVPQDDRFDCSSEASMFNTTSAEKFWGCLKGVGLQMKDLAVLLYRAGHYVWQEGVGQTYHTISGAVSDASGIVQMEYERQRLEGKGGMSAGLSTAGNFAGKFWDMVEHIMK